MTKISMPLTSGTREECIEYIRKLAEKLGYTPTRADIPDMTMTLIKKYYTAWSKIIVDAQLETFTLREQKEQRRAAMQIRFMKLANAYKADVAVCRTPEYEFLKLDYINRLKSDPHGLEPIGCRSTKEETKSYLRALSEKLGYSPTVNVTPCAKQILKKYPSWFEALEDAGLERSNTDLQSELREQINDEQFRLYLQNLLNEG